MGRRARVLLGLAAIATLAGITTAIGFLGKGPARSGLLLHTVRRQKLQPTLVERGALESADNADIVCRVKARALGSSVASTVRWAIEPGTQVQAGDKLIELDDSGLREQLKIQEVTVETAKATWIQAEEACKIGASQNASDLASARLKLDLTRIALRNYLEGEYPKCKRDIEGRLAMARTDLEMWQERSAWSTRMSRPERRYVSQAQAEADQARTASARIALKNVEEELRILEDPNAGTRVQNVKKLQGDIDEASRALERTAEQARAKEVQLEADRESKQSVYDKAAKAAEDIENEIRKCTICAPHAGLVVYYVSEQSRSGMGSQRPLVAQGEPVREGQRLLRIPDLSKMVVNIRVPEAWITRVHGEVWQKTFFSDAVQIALGTTPDLWGRLSSQALFARERQSFAETYKAAEQRLVEEGQQALVRVDAFPTRWLHGHIKSVSALTSQQDWLSADRKVYQTSVSIDEPLEGLRPDMSAEVTILTEAGRDDVVTVPLPAVVGSAEAGDGPKCIVMTPEGPVERLVILGLSNDKMVEVSSGLQEEEQVLLNP
jgi:multidrug resistance efflux pump